MTSFIHISLFVYAGMGKPEKGPRKNGESEPWVNRGGLHAELRVRRVHSPHSLTQKCPSVCQPLPPLHCLLTWQGCTSREVLFPAKVRRIPQLSSDERNSHNRWMDEQKHFISENTAHRRSERHVSSSSQRSSIHKSLHCAALLSWWQGKFFVIVVSRSLGRWCCP